MTASSQPDAAGDPVSLTGTRFFRRAGLSLAVLAALTAVITLAGQRIGQQLSLGGHTAGTETYDIVIGNDQLRLPANVLRFEDRRRTGFAERVDLYATWPDMEGYSDARRDRFNDASQSGGLIFLQISQSTMSRDMSGRIEPIYRHLFEGAAMPGPAGLTAHRMKAASGYGEEMFFTAPGDPSISANAYGVRCIMPAKPADSTSADCQRDIHAGQDLVVLYRFSSQLLPHWQAIDKSVSDFVRTKLVP